MSLITDIRAFAEAHPGRDPEELAEMFSRQCEVDDLVPLLAHEFRAVERNAVRLAEVELLSSTAVNAPVRSREWLGSLFALIDLPYRIGDGHARRFGALTVEQHTARIQILSGQIDGLQRDIELHELAVQTIATHGVSCLDELVASISEAA